MPSRGELCVQGLVALADAVGKPTGLVVHRNRAMPLDQSAHPSLVVYSTPASGAVGERVRRIDHDADSAERTLYVRAEIRCRGRNAAQLELDADTIYVWLVRQWASDSALSALAEDIRELSGSIEVQYLEELYLQRYVDFEIDYLTQVADPEAA